jgi:ankyrin repeat protein
MNVFSLFLIFVGSCSSLYCSSGTTVYVVYEAINNNEIEKATGLLAQCKEINKTVCKNGNKLLHYAAKGGHKELVEQLLFLKAKQAVANRSGRTPLLEAISGNYQEIVSLLAKNSPVLEVMDEMSGMRPLHYAAFLGYQDVVETLLKAGAHKNALSRAQKNAEWYAESEGHAALAEFIRDYKAEADQSGACTIS